MLELSHTVELTSATRDASEILFAKVGKSCRYRTVNWPMPGLEGVWGSYEGSREISCSGVVD